MPPSGPPPTVSARQRAAMIANARCMRKHGVPTSRTRRSQAIRSTLATVAPTRIRPRSSVPPPLAVASARPPSGSKGPDRTPIGRPTRNGPNLNFSTLVILNGRPRAAAATLASARLRWIVRRMEMVGRRSVSRHLRRPDAAMTSTMASPEPTRGSRTDIRLGTRAHTTTSNSAHVPPSTSAYPFNPGRSLDRRSLQR